MTAVSTMSERSAQVSCPPVESVTAPRVLPSSVPDDQYFVNVFDRGFNVSVVGADLSR
jgi:hypothetical protein